MTIRVCMGRVQAVGIALVMAAARGRFSGIMDIGGCKPPYFYCGSNARCTLETAACERADASAPSCSGTVSGAMYNLSGLRLTKGGANFMASDNTTTVIFDVCANAAPERCPNATAVAVDVTTCERLAGSAWTERMVLTALEHESTSINPAQGVRIRFDDGDRCAPSQNKSLFIDVYCEPTAVHAPVDIVLKRDGDCVSTIALRSAYGCPVGCAAGGANRAPCSGRGECVWTIQDGARCECDRDFAGSACQKYIVRTSTDFRIATWVWQAAAALLVSLTGVLVIARRCRDIRRQCAHERNQLFRSQPWNRAIYPGLGPNKGEVASGVELHRIVASRKVTVYYDDAFSGGRPELDDESLALLNRPRDPSENKGDCDRLMSTSS